jgi:predicted regulator of Ras-like GTPase activity (Roadblock/LC7/MglB family)
MQTAATKAFSVISGASATFNVDGLVVGAAMTGSAGGTLTIQPRTSTTTIGLGSSASGTLNLDDTELAYINGKFGALVIGSSSGTGAVAVNYGSTFTYTQPLTLRTASAGSITAADTLNTGSNALTISSGTISLVDVVSGELAVTGASGITLNGNVTTAGSQVFAGPISLASDITLDSRGAGTTGSSISFGSTTTINGAKALTIQAGVGAVNFGTTVGQSTALSSLAVTSAHATGLTLTGNVTTSGSQSYVANVMLAANSTLTTNGSAGSNVSITGTVSSGTIASTVYVTFYSGADLSGGVVTPDSSSYNSGSYSGGNASYRGYYNYYSGYPYYSTYTSYQPIYTNSMTVAGGEVTVYSSYGPSGSGTTFGIGNWNLSAFGGAVPSYVATNGSTPATFAISAGLGSITLGSTIGASRSLLSLSLASSTEISLNGNISTLKSQTYTGPVLLASAITLATTNSSANPTGATYNTSDDITFTSTVNSTTSTARNLTVATGFGDITFSGAVGGVQPLSTVALTSTGSTTFSGSVNASTFSQAGTTGTTILQGGGIATTSVQTYGNNVSLRVQDVTLTASAVTLNGTLTGAYGLVVNGNAIFGNDDSDRITLSGTNKSLIVTGNTSIYTDSISTSGVQTYGDSTADAISLYTTTSLSTASANKDISFNGTLNSATSTAKGLTISAGSGAVSFGAAVGNIYGLGAPNP